MKSTEEMSTRLQRVDMHDYFINKIKEAMEDEDYIAASWLIYSCLENRYFRTLQKVRGYCKYCRQESRCNQKSKNELAISIKICCIERLYINGVPCIRESFRKELFKETKEWVKQRNQLMHDLLSLAWYENTDELFRENAEEGMKILSETYKSCTEFRKKFYAEDYIFKFPEEAMERCKCKPTKKQK